MLFLAVLMMLCITDLSGVKVKADDEKWESDSIKILGFDSNLTLYGDDFEISALVETTDENAVVTYKWYMDGVELTNKKTQSITLTVNEYRTSGQHTFKCEATCGSDTVTASEIRVINILLTDIVTVYKESTLGESGI